MKKIKSIIGIILLMGIFFNEYVFTNKMVIAQTEKTDSLLGDVNNDGIVNTQDVIHLLMYTYFSEQYPLEQDCDYNNDTVIDTNDVIYLLMHTYFCSQYPLDNIKIALKEHLDYSQQTTQNINFNDYVKVLENVKYGVNRQKDMLIAYDESHYVKTNIYGYEASIDKYGQVVELNTNVSLCDGGMILSAHGTRKEEIMALEIGDFVLYYNNRVYVYKNEDIVRKNTIFSKFYDLVAYFKTVEDIDEYNEGISKLNELIPSLDYYFNCYDVELEKFLMSNLESIKEIDIYDHTHEYSYLEDSYDEYEITEGEWGYELLAVYDDKLYIGGFRNSDTLVYYDAKHYRERNAMGYEVSVNKEGIVVDKDTLVNLEDGGFILSGHTSTADYLYTNIEVSDKIEIIDGKVYIYRDNINTYYRKYVKLRNDLITDINFQKEQEIPHDYEYIDKIIKIIDNEISKINKDDLSLNKYIKISQSFNKINELIALAYGQLVEYEADQTRGIWYYPFGKLDIYDDTTLQGVQNTLLTFKRMGINEVIIHTFYKNYSLFDNSIFLKSSILDDCEYGEYGKDFLKCFIEEAHKLGITVSAFTQTFMENIETMKKPNDSYYQINYQGEKSLGQVHYYDICNDEV